MCLGTFLRLRRSLATPTLYAAVRILSGAFFNMLGKNFPNIYKKGTAHKELFLFCIYSPYVQYRNVLSVRILAKINPNGRAATISIAAANQEADAERFIVPRL